MNNALFRGLLYLILGGLIFLSCKKKTYEFHAVGKVYNKNTQEPIQGAEVILRDGMATNDPILPSEGGTSENVTTTDENGFYSVKLTSQNSWHAVLWVKKEAYRYEVQVEGTTQSYEMINEGPHVINLPLHGTAFFNSPFVKHSGSPSDQDTMLLHLLSYENIHENLYYMKPSEYHGVGAFHFLASKRKVSLLGDRYLRYKIEWTNDGIWQSKIDSVFLPTSTEVFQDTVYY